MMRAMFSAIAGLQNHITYMDVIGNNIANVNTTAFKAGRITFQDMLAQTTAGASAPTSSRGGTNPIQVGLGMRVGGIDVLHTQGSLQSTGKLTDFVIQGSGFFIIRDGSRSFYTRDGAFDISSTGELVSPTNGFRVQGWNANSAGVIDTTQPVSSVLIPFGQPVNAQESTTATFAGNLDSRLITGATISTTLDIYDSLGEAHPVTVTFTKNAAANTWDVTATSADPDVTAATPAPLQVIFNATGGITQPDPTTTPPTPLALSVTLAAATGASSPITTNINVTGMTQFGSAGQVSTTLNNGAAAGSLVTFSVGPAGDITGTFTNGQNRLIGQVAMAIFSNPGGMLRAGDNSFEQSPNSGIPIIGTPDTAGRGTVGTWLLEGSNTDLAREFTNVVIAQRGFQASSRIIGVADEMLADLVNLRR